MHDQRVSSRLLRGLRKSFKSGFRVLLVDADTALDGDRDRHRRFHGGDAVADQIRLRHQAGAEAAVLHAIGRTAGIEVDLVKSQIGANARALCERSRIRPTKLQCDRMLGRIVTKKPRAVAVQHCPGGQHFGVRAARGASAGDGKTGSAGRSIPSSERHKSATGAFFANFLVFQSLHKFPIYLVSYHFRLILTDFRVRGTISSYFADRVVPQNLIIGTTDQRN